MSLRLAGFEIRDYLMYVFGSGFPKSYNISKGVDKYLGGERKNTGKIKPGHEEFANRGNKSSVQSFKGTLGGKGGFHRPWMENPEKIEDYHYVTSPGTLEAEQWEGYGTALKPAYEPIILARKPVEGNNVKNCLKYGCGGLNIDECRIGYSEKDDPRIGKEYSHNAKSGLENGVHKDNSLGQKQQLHKPQGRWPTNLILDGSEEVEEMFPNSKSTGGQKSLGAFRNGDIYGKGRDERESGDPGYGDNGSSSRFFQKCSFNEEDRIVYSSKVSKKERNAGLDALEDDIIIDDSNSNPVGLKSGTNNSAKDGERNPNLTTKNPHPTLKPVSLCEYLAKLILPPTENSKLIVPFAGTGSEMAGALKAG